MAGSDTEEKTLDPTEHKLRKSRERGQVSSSSDFVNSSVTIAGIVYVLFTWPNIVALFNTLLSSAIAQISHANAAGTVNATSLLASQLSNVAIPLLVITASAGLLANIGHKSGLVISLEPLSPDFNRINPAQGFSKIFGVRGLTEVGVSLVRVSVWLIAAASIVWGAVPEVIGSPYCSMACVAQSGVDLGRPLVVVAVIVLIATGLMDLPVQMALFRRDMRMGRSELKREFRETEGSPEFAVRRKEQHRSAVGLGAAAGLGDATLIIAGAADAVAISYDPVHTPVPIVVAKGRGPHAVRIIDAARQMRLPIEIDAKLAAILLDGTAVMSHVPRSTFNAVAIAILKGTALRRR